MCYVIDTESSIYLVLKYKHSKNIYVDEFFKSVDYINSKFNELKLDFVIDTSRKELMNFTKFNEIFDVKEDKEICFMKDLSYIDRYIDRIIPSKISLNLHHIKESNKF